MCVWGQEEVMVFQSKQQTVYLAFDQLNIAPPFIVGIFKLPNANVEILLAFMLHSFYRQSTGKFKNKTKKNNNLWESGLFAS